MAEADNGFRTALVGGFQRDDVLRYIEDAARRHAEETAALKEKLDEAERRAKEQSARADSLTEKNAELLERLGVGTTEVPVDPEELTRALRAERFRRSRRFMLALPRSLGRVRLAIVEDDLLAEHVAAWCASR